jgi:hypothetical protein
VPIGHAALVLFQRNQKVDADTDANKALAIAYKKCASIPHPPLDSGMDDLVFHTVQKLAE